MAEELLNGHSSPAGDNLKDLRPILQAILRTNEDLAAQNKALYQLLASGDTSSTQWHSVTQPKISMDTYGRDSEGPPLSRRSHVDPLNSPETNAEIWYGILSISANESQEFMESYYRWPRPSRIEEVLNERRRWTSWSYAAAFPALSRFLKRATMSHRCCCQVWMEDLDGVSEWGNSISYGEAKRNVNVLWNAIKDRAVLPSAQTEPEVENAGRVSVRLFQIVDLSPLVLAAILGSTPQSDLSYMAAFIERHLNFSNWGKVSLLRFGELVWSSYTFEYHFSFYYVTPEYITSESTKLDPRQTRKSAPFGREQATQTRYIHEETLSFLLVGHFKDVTSCLQLAESYFKFDPYKKNTQSGSFRPYNTRQPPALLLLSWISVGLHHVLWRWQSAIEAVESEIKSSAQIVFLEDRSDLMADDPQFSLSKTYFWALQAYKLFEQTLLETISAWKTFRLDSLPRLRDPRVTSEEWNTSIQDIDDAIEQLQAKVLRIRKRIDEVKDLRTGLISASALFDSRTAVRQGENIRLLTYITILFFPLGFATSIFGMQIMTPNDHAVTAFAISLPSITVGTALLVFNLEHILNVWTSLTENWATWLRHGMRQHRRKDWKDRAIALHEDDELTRAPVRKAMRQSSGWVYLLFLLEYVLVELPVGEIGAVMGAVGLLNRDSLGAQTHKRTASVRVEDGDDADHAGSGSTRQEQMRERIKQRIEQSLEEEKRREKAKRYEERGSFKVVMSRSRKSTLEALKTTMNIVLVLLRALFIPLWMLVLSLEYMILVMALTFRPPRPPRIHPSPSTSAGAKRKSVFARAWGILGLSILLPLTKPTAAKEKPDEEDFEFRAVNRVATLLGGTSMTSPRTNTDPSMTTSPSMSSLKRNYNSSSTNLTSPGPKSNFNSSRQMNRTDANTPLPSMVQHAEDILSLPTQNTRSVSPAARKTQRAGRLAKSGLNLNLKSQVEMQDMDETSGGGKAP